MHPSPEIFYSWTRNAQSLCISNILCPFWVISLIPRVVKCEFTTSYWLCPSPCTAVLTQRKYMAPGKMVGNFFPFISSSKTCCGKNVSWSDCGMVRKSGFEEEGESAAFRMTQSLCSPSWQKEEDSSSLIETTLFSLWAALALRGYKPRLIQSSTKDGSLPSSPSGTAARYQ